MTDFEIPLITLLLLGPLTGALLVTLLPRGQVSLIRWVALGCSAVTLGYALLLLTFFDSNTAGIQLYEHYVWNPRLGTAYAVGIDGISLSMLILAALLSFVAIVASKNISDGTRGYYALMLLLETAMFGVFTAQDWALFYVFWELTLIPLFFLIDRWGGENRQGAALNFVLYTMGGSIFMLLSLLVLFDSSPNNTFAMSDMTVAARNLSDHRQLLIFLGLLIGFGVKMPIFPLHGWLPLAHVEAPAPVSILLSGILLKMGSYGIIRAAEMMPVAVLSLQNLLMVLAFIGIVYGGLLAWRQRDLKRMIAYSSVSHMGVVLLGIATLNLTGLTGAVAQMVAHGLVAGAAFLLVGLLYERTHQRDIAEYGALVEFTPRFAFFMVLAFLAAVGMPGTFGFVTELHVLIGGFERWSWAIVILAFSILISAAYAIRTVGRFFTGPRTSGASELKDMRLSEVFVASLLVGGAILFGIFPAPVLELSSVAVGELSSHF